MAENLLQPVSKYLPPEGRAQPGRTARQAALCTQCGSLGDSGGRQGQAVVPAEAAGHWLVRFFWEGGFTLCILSVGAPQVVKNPPAHAGDTGDAGLIPESRRCPGREHGNPLQCSCLEHSVDSGAWWDMTE